MTIEHNLVLVSGGLDSSVALADQIDKNGKVSAISFLYGQRHSRELESAKLLTAYYRRLHKDFIGKHHILDLEGAKEAFKGSSLTGKGEVPLGHYADVTMKKTVVPNRNMIFLSLASGVAIANNLKKVVYGAHAGDHAVYPDCRPEFFKLVAETVKAGNYDGPDLYAPFIGMTKADIVKRGIELDVPFQLTRSCYREKEVHCGTCSTCRERRWSFLVVGATDPVEYDPVGLKAVTNETLLKNEG